MVEPQIVVLVVAGSSPVGHPARSALNLAIKAFVQRRSRNGRFLRYNRRVVCPNPWVKNYKIVIDAILQTCNLGRHVHKSHRHMALFRAITFT